MRLFVPLVWAPHLQQCLPIYTSFLCAYLYLHISNKFTCGACVSHQSQPGIWLRWATATATRATTVCCCCDRLPLVRFYERIFRFCECIKISFSHIFVQISPIYFKWCVLCVQVAFFPYIMYNVHCTSCFFIAASQHVHVRLSMASNAHFCRTHFFSSLELARKLDRSEDCVCCVGTKW